MTQNNIYMDNENSEIKVNVKPEAEDIVMNAAASAAASATSASVSASTAAGLLESIRGIKTGVENFVTQAMDGLQDLYANLTAQLSSLKDTCVQNVNTSYTSAIQLIRQTEMEVLTIIRNLGAGYVNEAAEYARAAQEIVDFHVSTEHLNQSKGLLTGDISDDTTVMSDVRKYAHSTFAGYQGSNASPVDPKKFTKNAGWSGIITADGIASGFSSSGWLLCPSYNFVNTATLEFEFTPDKITNTGDLGLLGGGENGGLILRQVNAELVILYSTNGSSWTTGVTSVYNGLVAGTSYKVKIVFNSLGLIVYINGTQEYSNQTVGKVYALPHEIGRVNFSGSIDLKQLSITVDGVPVFSGNKTGIDTIKPDNYDVVGTPTISADGIFSCTTTPNTNYIAYDGSVLYPHSSSIYESFKLRFRGNPNISSFSDIFNFLNSGFWGYIGTDCGLSLMCGIDGANRYLGLLPASYWGQWVDILWERTATEVKASYKLATSDEYISDGSYTTTANDIGQYFSLGYNTLDTTNSAFEIDLNETKFYHNGELIWQPCLKIPYTESKTGSKIVDSIYRDRVNDMATQFGYAPYYTLDEDNGNFTLPMGELYGMIEILRNKINELSTQT